MFLVIAEVAGIMFGCPSFGKQYNLVTISTLYKLKNKYIRQDAGGTERCSNS
jgi:hypothetical protein